MLPGSGVLVALKDWKEDLLLLLGAQLAHGGRVEWVGCEWPELPEWHWRESWLVGVIPVGEA